MAHKTYIVGDTSTILHPKVIRKFALKCWGEIMDLDRRHPGSLIDPDITTTAEGTPGITVIDNPGDIKVTRAKNFNFLAAALLADTSSRIGEGLVNNEWVELLLTTDLERDSCQDPTNFRRVIRNLVVISWNQHPLYSVLHG